MPEPATPAVPTPAAFISYSRDDAEFALRLAQDLKAAGAPVWIDQLDIVPGELWDNAIEEALIASPRILLILSPGSARSNNVRNEISFALEQGKTVIPILYHDCTVPLQLQRANRVDFRADYTRGLASLLANLHIANPDPAILHEAAEAEARRHAAWQARDAEALRLRQREEQRLSGQRLADEKRREEFDRLAREGLYAQQIEAERQAHEAEAAPHARTSSERQIPPPPIAVAPLPPLPAARSFPRTGIWIVLAAVFVGALLLVLFVQLRKPSAPKPPETAASAAPAVATQPTPSTPTPPPAETTQPTAAKSALAAPVSPRAVNLPPAPAKPEPPAAKPSAAPPAPLRVEPKPLPVPPPAEPSADSPATRRRKAAEMFKLKRYPEALTLMTQGCDQFGGDNCEDEGYLYENGLGVSQDYGKAKDLYTKACDSGSAGGCNDLGYYVYQLGHGAPQDYTKAKPRFQKACDAGNALSCNNLGILYYYALGGPQDPDKAKALFQKACDGGNANGCIGLGDSYRNGRGVAKDLAKAKELYQKGCNMGSTPGCDRLKEMQ